jgi:hypothetical protein
MNQASILFSFAVLSMAGAWCLLQGMAPREAASPSAVMAQGSFLSADIRAD